MAAKTKVKSPVPIRTTKKFKISIKNLPKHVRPEVVGLFNAMANENIVVISRLAKL